MTHKLVTFINIVIYVFSAKNYTASVKVLRKKYTSVYT